MNRERSKGLAACLVLLVIGCGLLFDRTWRYGEVLSPADVLDSFFPWAADGPRREPTNATRSDEAFYHQPLMLTHWPRLRSGDFPEWNPLVLGGTPAFQNGLDVGRALSPLSLPFYLLDANTAVTLYGPLRLIAAGLLMWLYLRSASLSPAASAAGAVIFAFNGAFVVWLTAPMPTVALWLPLIALGVERVVHRGTIRWAGLLALAIGLQFLGGYLPTSIVVMSLAGLWAAGWLAAREAGSGPPVTRVVPLMVVAGAVGVVLAAGALGPMLTTLSDSPASGRSMRSLTLPWQNLATFALPGFWGSPLARNWWSPFGGNYPEFVTYVGILPMALAGTGAALAIARRDTRAVLALVALLFSVMQMYGWPPASWVSYLPGFRQMNPYRWNAGLVFAVAVLSATGLESFLSRRDTAVPSSLARIKAVLPALIGLLLAGCIAALALFDQFGRIRELNFQAYEKSGVVVFVALALMSGALCAILAYTTGRLRLAAGWIAVAVAALDLIVAGHGFNPTLPRERLYQSTPGIAFLQRSIGEGRLAPMGESYLLPESHVWGLYGLPAVVGFDFFGASDYQAFLARAARQPARPPRWDFVGLNTANVAPDLRLLGLLGVNLLATPPLDSWTHAPGYTTVGELTAGRTIAQTFTARYDGLRRIDLLTATFARPNAGAWAITLIDLDTEALVASWHRDAASLPDVDWLSLNLPPQFDSAGRQYRLEIQVEGASPGRGATLLATPEGGLEHGVLDVDGKRDPRALWLRVFSTAPDRIPGATLEYARDVNVYRNPFARPRAWFVQSARVVPSAEQLDALASIDTATTALVESPLATGPSAQTGRITLASDLGDQRRFTVDAPDGGIVVFSERFDEHWRLSAETQDVPLVRANSVLMAAAVAPGVQTLTLTYDRSDWKGALVCSALALAGIAIAVFWQR